MQLILAAQPPPVGQSSYFDHCPRRLRIRPVTDIVNVMQRASHLLVALLLLPITATPGQEKAPKAEPPRLCLTFPLGVVPGQPFRFSMRGQRLDAVTAIRFHEPKTFGYLTGKAKKVSVPNQMEPNRVGDMQLDAELTLPPNLFARTVPFTVVSPAGESNVLSLLVLNDITVTTEQEPNDGFQQAMPLTFPLAIRGTIPEAHDVDVFRFVGRTGQRLAFDVHAARYGSALDPYLALYDASGREIAANDDHGGSADARIDITLPHDGVYYLSLSDALDQGGPGHVYCLIAEMF
jgi:hypothetical protein